MNTRNYGTGTREMRGAARILLNSARDRGETSFSTVDTVSDRFVHFVTFAKENGIGRLERVERDLVITYGRSLAEKVDDDEMSASYAQNLVSAVNTVMQIARSGQWHSVSPTQECDIAKRSAIRHNIPVALDRTVFKTVVKAVSILMDYPLLAIVLLPRELGLRTKEASLLNCHVALKEAKTSGVVAITRGTKGGLKRQVPITTEAQINALELASRAQQEGKNLIPKGMTWETWREGDLRKARDLVKAHTSEGLRDLRAAYACERYETLTGHPASVVSGLIVDRGCDRTAREQIALELGHGRIDVVSAYIGGRS